MAEAESDGQPHFSHFGPEANLFAELEALFRDYAETRHAAQRRKYLHDDGEAAPYEQEPGTFTAWEDAAAEPTCCSTKACTAPSCTTGRSTSRGHADLLIGVVPVINLEWIQKLHRDQHACAATRPKP